jgi:hypothetical protein
MSLPQPTMSAKRIQALVGLFLFLLVTSLFAGLDLLTHSKDLAAWLDRQEEESSRQTRKTLLHVGYWQTMDELWIYGELPHLDVSKGGVYLLGASDVQCATKLWELSPDLQALIHNFGISDSNPKGELVELRYLIENRGILTAGGEKSLVVLGADYHTARHPSQLLSAAFIDNWERRGLFVCDPQNGIRAVPVNAISKCLDFEVTRAGAGLARFRNLFFHQFIRWRHHGTEPPRTHDLTFYTVNCRREMGSDWKEKIEAYIQTFGETLDYLVAQHVQTRVILMPQGSWYDDLPYEQEFREQIRTLCAGKQIPVSDWSTMLTDEDFADSIHPNVYGMEKFHPAFLKIALSFLRSTHALSPTPSSVDQTGN